MPGPEFGSAHIEVTADADQLDRQVRRMAAAAGRTGGERFTKAFNAQTAKIGRSLRGNFRSLNGEMTTSEKIVKRLDRSFLKLWKTLPHGARQLTFYIALFANLGEAIAALSSALGPGLLNLGAIISALAIGVGVGVAAFWKLNGAIADMPKEIQPAARAFQNLGKAFGRLQKVIQIAALRNAAGAFESFEKTIDGLQDPLAEVGSALGRIINSIARGLAPGTKGFQTLTKVIRAAGPILERITRTVGILAQGLGNAFASPALNRSVMKLIDWLDRIFTQFEEFTGSRELDIWFSRADRIFGAVGRLLDATGRALNNLVDEGAVTRLVNFTDNLAEFMPSLERMLDVLGELDLFGLIAQALNEIGDALAPLHDPLMDVFDALNDIVSIAIDQWATRLGDAAGIAAPLIQAIADALADVDEDTIRGIADGLLVLSTSLLAVKAASAGVALLGTLATTLKTLKNTKVTWKGILGGLTAGALAATITSMFADNESVESKLSNAFTGLIVGGLVGAKAGPIGAAVGALVGLVATRIADEWDKLIQADWNPFDNDWGALFDDAGRQLAEGLPGFFENFAPDWIEGWNQLLDIRETINEFFYDLSDSLAEGWDGLAEDTEVGIANFRDSVLEWFGALPTALSAWFVNDFWPGVIGWWNDGWANTAASFSNGWDQIVTWWNTIRSSTNTWFTETFWPGVVTWWNEGWARTGASFAGGWDQISRWWATIQTQVQAWFLTFWTRVAAWWNDGWARTGRNFGSGWDQISSWFTGISSGFNRWLADFIRSVNEGLSKIKELTGGFVDLQIPVPSVGGGGGMASGGLALNAQRRLIGEDGPEAVVPLDRPLSRVDPSVRGLSAVAQGLAGAPGGSGGRSTIIEAGAIQITTTLPDARLIGSGAIDAIVAKL